MPGFKIMSVSEPRSTSKGEVRDCKFQELSTKRTYRVGVFCNETEWYLNVGDEIDVAINKGKPYKGEDTWSCGLNHVTPIQQLPQAEVKQVVKPAITNTELGKKFEKKETDWDAKEKREHKRALTMQAFSLFPPITDETEGTPMDRWLKVKEMRDIMLNDLYCD